MFNSQSSNPSTATRTPVSNGIPNSIDRFIFFAAFGFVSLYLLGFGVFWIYTSICEWLESRRPRPQLDWDEGILTPRVWDEEDEDIAWNAELGRIILARQWGQDRWIDGNYDAGVSGETARLLGGRGSKRIQAAQTKSAATE